MSSAAETVENASIISESTAHDGNRLWIGNIDPKITEWVKKKESASALTQAHISSSLIHQISL